MRRARDGAFVVVVLNFTPVPRHNYRIGLPAGGRWREIFNSDSAYYSGSNVGNAGGSKPSRAVDGAWPLGRHHPAAAGGHHAGAGARMMAAAKQASCSSLPRLRRWSRPAGWPT